jgi:hypothetical protein
MRPVPVIGDDGGRLATIAGGSPEADDEPRAGAPRPASAGGSAIALPAAVSTPYAEVVLVAVVFGAASVVFGIFPSPLFDVAAHAGHALSGLF